jgi:hypothetical protein
LSDRNMSGSTVSLLDIKKLQNSVSVLKRTRYKIENEIQLGQEAFDVK